MSAYSGASKLIHKRIAHFSNEEITRVLSHYDIGKVHRIETLFGGNARTPKMAVISDKGKFLVKRRPKRKDDTKIVEFAHSVQAYLADKGFPASMPVPLSDGSGTYLQMHNHIYEFFRFIAGSRYDGSAGATIEAGRQLAIFHRRLAEFTSQWKPVKTSFHDSTSVRRYLKIIEAGEKDEKLYETVDVLTSLYNAASVRANQLGFDSWPGQVVHGDWHPGNMLFAGQKLIAMLDFESVRIAPAVTDLANGMLQFSVVGGRPNPIDWPDYVDQAKLLQFLNGYREVIAMEKAQLDSLIDLMIETIIAEAVLPIAATGFFGHLSGTDFLVMIRRKAKWLHKNREKLTEAIES